jgi:hypothetical protein
MSSYFFFEVLVLSGLFLHVILSVLFAIVYLVCEILYVVIVELSVRSWLQTSNQLQPQWVCDSQDITN